MATSLVYTIAPYIPFTKILSASANADKADIQNRVNWAGGTDATTGLGDDNLQSNTAAGGGLTRATKLKLGTPDFAVFNDSTGAMTEAASLPSKSGGTGLSVIITIADVGKVFTVNSGGTVSLSVVPVPPTLNVFNYSRYS